MGVNKIKNNGEVFTPTHIVDDMLALVSYNPNYEKQNVYEIYENIFMKHIIDNSCGDGAILERVVINYINSFIRINKDICGLSEHLSKYIHGIEIDPDNHKKCIDRLNSIEFHVPGVEEMYKVLDINVNWDIKCADALTITEYDNKMDYVIGNPPYVRIHNLQNKKILKKYMFCNEGMTDLYLAFFELSFRQLNNDGKMAFITPNSWLTSNAAQLLREYIRENKNLIKLVDFGHYQVFEGITTYSLISIFNKSKNYEVKCYGVNPDDGEVYSEPLYNINYANLFINNHIYICSEKEREIIFKVMREANNKQFRVKNGFATLADNIFIKKLPYDLEYEIPVYKASTGEIASCIYPYDINGKPFTEEEFKEKSPHNYNYLLENKDKLLNRSIKNKDEWYLFGRTQAINDVEKDKISVPSIIKNQEDFIKKLKKVPCGCGVYGGIYILGDYNIVIEKLSSPDFLAYIKSLRKYKNGGYYTFSSKDLEKYLNNY